jgi:mono/diheme cytochrome c family protein
MARRLIVLGILLGAGVSLLAFPWSRDMVSGPAVMPQTLPRTPPPGVLAIDGMRIWDRTEANEKLVNPLTATPPVLAEGASLYAINCAVCHGAGGQGDGQLAKHYRIMPDLSHPFIQAYSDGWLYSVVTEGGLDMPGHAEALSPRERWAVIHHMRSLGEP